MLKFNVNILDHIGAFEQSLQSVYPPVRQNIYPKYYTVRGRTSVVHSVHCYKPPCWDQTLY